MGETPREMQPAPTPRYRPSTVAEAYERIQRSTTPWVAIGDFLDDWRRTSPAERPSLVAQRPNGDADTAELRRWVAFCAAMVEWLCWNAGLPFPGWTTAPEYVLPDPWFLYPGWRLRAWQLMTTPAPFKMRNIFGGDHILDRV